MSETTLREPEQLRTEVPRYVIRYGNTRLLGNFETRRDQRLLRGDEVIVR